MIDLEKIELFNVEETVKTDLGYTLYRYPISVINSLSVPVKEDDGVEGAEIWTGHKESASETVGIEIRFYSLGRHAKIKLKSNGYTQVSVYFGDFFGTKLDVQEGEIKEIETYFPDQMKGVKEASYYRFDKHVYRFMIYSSKPIELLDVSCDGEMRKPSKSEIPAKKMICYGSSISHGCGTPYPHLNYINTAANALKIDIYNKALGGGCFCEREMKDYLMSLDFDYGYFEMGTNIADKHPNVIENRMGKFIDELCEKFPNKTLFFMTPIKGLSDVSDTTFEYEKLFANTKRVITEHASKYKNAVVLDGHKLLNNDTYLCCDILHPGDLGHVFMGFNLFNMIKDYIK